MGASTMRPYRPSIDPLFTDARNTNIMRELPRETIRESALMIPTNLENYDYIQNYFPIDLNIPQNIANQEQEIDLT